MTETARHRRLARLADPTGMFRILALDHRDSLRVMVSPDRPDEIPAAALRELKADLVGGAAAEATGVMLDPEVGMDQEVVAAVPPDVGIIAALEAQGYLAEESVTSTTLLEDWSAARATAAGADAVKLLALWDGSPNPEQRSVIDRAGAEAHQAGVPLVLEPLPRRLPLTGDWVVDWAREHRGAQADLLKLPYPGSAEACRRLSELLDLPWVLLSAGAPFEDFLQQLETALGEGAAGYIAGRAVWREAATLDRTDRLAAIRQWVMPRLEQLAEIGRT